MEMNEKEKELFEAIKNKDNEKVKLILENNNIDSKWFLRYRNLEILKYLAEHAADVNAKNVLSIRPNGGRKGPLIETICLRDIMDRIASIRVSEKQYLELVKSSIGKEANNINEALEVALEYGNLEIVKYLIEKGVDINAKNIALIRASENGYLDIVKYLVEHGADINVKDKSGNTALMIASKGMRLEIVKYLVEHGADVNAKNAEGKTALYLVNEEENSSITYDINIKGHFEALVVGGSDGKEEKIIEAIEKAIEETKERANKIIKILNWRDFIMPNKEKITKRKEKTSKIEPQIRERFFNAIKNNDIEKIKSIVESEVPIVDTKCINEALRVALAETNLEIVKYLIENGAYINTKDEDGETALILASEKENWELVKYLVEKGADNIDYALSIALKKENWELVKYLIENGASDINYALINATISGNLELVKYLIEHGADVNTEYKDGYNNKTALMLASEKENWELVKYLIEKGADNIDYALSIASKKEYFELFKWFGENRADNINDALIFASENGYLELVKYLVESGADINTKNKDGKSILIIALEKENVELVKYFKENGAEDINRALMSASEDGYLEMVKYLVEHVEDVNAKNMALMIASQYGKLGVVKCLVENGADINAKDKDGKTALIHAVENGYLRIIEYFIEKGIDINAKYDYNKNPSSYYKGDGIKYYSYKGVTILMIALRYGTIRIVKYLVEKGADVNIEDYKCNTALDFADNEEVRKILIEAGAI